VVRGRAARSPARGAAIRGAPALVQLDLADFADFVRSSQGKMVRLAELLTGDRGRAEDLAQDGYAKAYAAWSRIRGGDPQAYVRRCIVNAHTDWWRRRTWREQPRPVVPDRPERADMPTVHATRDVVLRALARLTARERAVIALRFYLDLTEFQIASELGIAPGTVKSTVSRAIAKLRADAELRAEAAS
jgi:RNA polymerase sigma-70 factor (sigma-E family)